mgnify:CR=1 FL=1
MPITRQQIQAEEARTGVKQVAMRRAYNAQIMESGGKRKRKRKRTHKRPRIAFYDIVLKKKFSTSKYKLLKTKNGKYRASAKSEDGKRKLSVFVKKKFYEQVMERSTIRYEAHEI